MRFRITSYFAQITQLEGVRVEVQWQASFAQSPSSGQCEAEEEKGRDASLRGQCILTGGEVISGGVDMSPKSSNWVTACKDIKDNDVTTRKDAAAAGHCLKTSIL